MIDREHDEAQGLLESEQLQGELEEVKQQIRDSIRDGAESELIRLRARADILPAKILNQRIREAEAELAAIQYEQEQALEDRTAAGEAISKALESKTHAEAALRNAEREVAAANSAHAQVRSQQGKLAEGEKEISNRLAALHEELEAYVGSR